MNRTISELIERFPAIGDRFSKIQQGNFTIPVRSPITCSVLGYAKSTSLEEYHGVVENAVEEFKRWRLIPAPRRGEIIRQIGIQLREHKRQLGELISIEVGKIRVEGEGEIQEAIDIADFAVGLSRQLYGLTMHSERPNHRMYEQWHPLGVVGVITAFNFPAEVWAWNSCVAAV